MSQGFHGYYVSQIRLQNSLKNSKEIETLSIISSKTKVPEIQRLGKS